MFASLNAECCLTFSRLFQRLAIHLEHTIMFCSMLRYHNEMFKCLYDRLEDECGAIPSDIYTTYHVKTWQPLLSTINCTLSEWP